MKFKDYLNEAKLTNKSIDAVLDELYELTVNMTKYGANAAKAAKWRNEFEEKGGNLDKYAKEVYKKVEKIVNSLEIVQLTTSPISYDTPYQPDPNKELYLKNGKQFFNKSGSASSYELKDLRAIEKDLERSLDAIKNPEKYIGKSRTPEEYTEYVQKVTEQRDEKIKYAKDNQEKWKKLFLADIKKDLGL